MMRAMILALGAACLLACSPKAPEPAPSPAASPAAVETPAPTPEPDPSARPATAEACTAAGGAWQPVCRRQLPQCVTTFADAQKACKDGDDCMGDCLVHGEAEAGKPAEGLCAANDDPCGCRQTVEDGLAQGTLCVD